MVCSELLVLLNKRIAQKTSSVVNQISKIASSLIRKLKYGGADSRTWRARIVSKPSYPQFNFFLTTTVIALFVEQVVFVLVERKGAYYLYFRATTFCMLDGLFNL